MTGLYHPHAIALLVVDLGDGEPIAFSVIPRSVEVARNAARKADTCRLTIDLRDLPLDPRALSVVHVNVHIGEPPRPEEPFQPTPANERFVGIVDAPEMVLGDDNHVTLECRDYTGAWLDRSWTAFAALGTEGVDALQTLGALVELARSRVAPLTRPAVFQDPTAASKIIGQTEGKTVWTPSEDRATAWDALVELCAEYGLTPVYDRAQLEIRAASRFGQRQAFMVMGENITRLTLRKDFAKPSKKRVLVKCWDPVQGVALEGAWPLESDVLRDIQPGGAAEERIDQVQYNVEGSYTPPELQELARHIHDEAATREIDGSLTTRELRDTRGQSLLVLANGDTLQVDVSPDFHGVLQAADPGGALYRMMDPGNPNRVQPAVAQALFQAWQRAQASPLEARFYVKEALHKWTREDGYTLDLDFIHFVFSAGA